jgi:hypothetical protein
VVLRSDRCVELFGCAVLRLQGNLDRCVRLSSKSRLGWTHYLVSVGENDGDIFHYYPLAKTL